MKILLAIDGSPCGEATIAEVSRFPWPAQSEVQIVTVETRLEPSRLEPRRAKGVEYAFDAIIKQQHAEALKLLRHATKLLKSKTPELRVTSLLLEGFDKDAIVAEAERWAADIVVVGSHGYGPIRRFFLGSVSSFVANNAPCTVMIVRPPGKK